MDKTTKYILLTMFIFLVLTPIALLFGNKFRIDKISNNLKQIPVPESATFIGQIQTGYPDGSPNIHQTYTVKSSPKEVLKFYEDLIAKNKWEITERWYINESKNEVVLKFKVSPTSKPITLMTEVDAYDEKGGTRLKLSTPY